MTRFERERSAVNLLYSLALIGVYHGWNNKQEMARLKQEVNDAYELLMPKNSKK